MRHCVYILFSVSCYKFYTGQTQDFDNRLAEHNRGETPSIKSCIPWKLVWLKEVETRVEALKLEKKIKSRGANRFLIEQGVMVN
ncbi:MAG: GIY-YIG nuclease family protein [Cyclobacteriaceae bacterium]|nr:GIY-YIG nuclease family protein [Cyclobacteriaceae bacterium]